MERTCPGIARMACLRMRTFAADAPPLDAAGLARLAASGHGGEVRLRLHPALRRLASPYPLAALWRCHRAGEAPASIPGVDGEWLVLHRAAGRPQVTPVAPARFALLAALARGLTLGQIAAAGHDLTALPELIGAGWIGGFDCR